VSPHDEALRQEVVDQLSRNGIDRAAARLTVDLAIHAVCEAIDTVGRIALTATPGFNSLTFTLALQMMLKTCEAHIAESASIIVPVQA